MRAPTRGWITACLFAWVGCFTETGDTDDDDDAATTGNSTDPTLTTTTVDPSLTTSLTATTDVPTATSIDPSSDTDPSVDSSGTTDSDTDTSTTTDPTVGECVVDSDAVCSDDMVVAGELCFLEPVSVEGGEDQIGAIAIADIDDDQTPDIAFTDGSDGYVAFATNGIVDDATAINGMTSTWSVDVGSLGGDAAIAFGGATAEVYIARYDGSTFVVDPPLNAPGEFVTARFGEFDNDNHLDLLVASEESGTLYLYVNNGSGEFVGEPDPIVLSGTPGVSDMRVIHHPVLEGRGLAVLTRDGRLFLVAQSGGVLGDVSEIYSAQTYDDPTTGKLAAGDLDADDDTDLAVGFDGRAFVFRASQLGYDDPLTLGDAASGTITPAFGDIDNDGLADVVLADAEDTSIEIYIAVDEGFSHAAPIQTPATPRAVGVADFNGDCAADIVALGPMWFEVSAANP